jgi:hypothetical protein
MPDDGSEPISILGFVAYRLRTFYRQYELYYDRRNTAEWEEELRWLPDGRLTGTKLPDQRHFS